MLDAVGRAGVVRRRAGYCRRRRTAGEGEGEGEGATTAEYGEETEEESNSNLFRSSWRTLALDAVLDAVAWSSSDNTFFFFLLLLLGVARTDLRTDLRADLCAEDFLGVEEEAGDLGLRRVYARVRYGERRTGLFLRRAVVIIGDASSALSTSEMSRGADRSPGAVGTVKKNSSERSG